MLRRIHLVTYISVVAGAAVLVLLNLPGQIVTEVEISDGPPGRMRFARVLHHCEHGWPVSYLEREPASLGESLAVDQFSPWDLKESVTEFAVLPLIVDIALAVAIVVVVGTGLEFWRRRTRRLQVSLCSVLGLVVVVAVLLSYYSTQRASYEEQARILRAMEEDLAYFGYGIEARTTWTVGGPTWLRQLVGDEYFRALDRVVGIITEGPELSYVSELRHLRAVTIRDGASNSQLKFLERLPDLEALEMQRADVIEEPGCARGGKYDRPYFQLPRLPNLRLLDMSETEFRGDGLEHMRRLEALDVSVTHMDDQTAAWIGQNTNMKNLRLKYADITDEGMRHFRSLDQLKELYLGSTDITDEGMRHLRSLHQLERLSLSGTDITDEGIKSLAELRRLKRLDLHGSEVSDASIPTLAGLKNLEYLGPGNTRMTEEGCRELKDIIPAYREHSPFNPF